MSRILIVEDEPAIAELIAINLRHAGFEVTIAGDAEQAQVAVDGILPSLVVLDWMLPGQSGHALARAWRAQPRTRELPIIMLTARADETDKVAGLDAGADDYLAKPFQTEELIARLRALIRRSSGNASSELKAGDIRLDTRSGKVTKAGEPVKLTAQEYKLLSYLMHHKGKVVSRTELIEHIYDQDFDRDSNTIEVFVGRLRKKIGPDRIETVRGLGYRLVALQGEAAG